MTSFVVRIAFIASFFLLTGCDSAEERAEKHFESAVELLEEGDISRAIIEFRNVIALDDTNSEARRLYARAARSTGNIADAYENFLALAELEPNDLEARLALAEIAILAQSWDAANNHAERLRSMEGEIEGRETVELAIRFREAVLDEDMVAIAEQLGDAERLYEDRPSDPILERILIEGYLHSGNVRRAIEVTESAIERGDQSEIYYLVLADLLASEGENERLEAHLQRMLEIFPGDLDAKQRLIALYVRDGRADSAEAFVRSEMEAAEDKVTAHVGLIALIRNLRGEDAALAELDRALAIHEGNALLLALKAGMLFDRGDQEEAVTLMNSVLEIAETGDETDRYKVTLAKMLVATGDQAGARDWVEQVLDRDPGQVAALKMKAGWQIDADENDAAIATLRQALDQEPDDAETMTLMARAHERNGDRELAQDLLSLAVEASNNAPAESLRMAGSLIRQERYRTAEEILVSALRRSPGHLELLITLGQIYVVTEDWPRAEQVVSALRRIEDNRAAATADDLQTRIVSRREGRDLGIVFLENLVASGGADVNGTARIRLIRARLAANQGERALELAEEVARDLPNDTGAAMVLGNTQFALGRLDEAEATFRAILEKTPDNGLAAIQMVRLMSAQGRSDEARELIETGLNVNPDQPDLLWARASYLERENDIDGAIETYERLYALNGESPIIANNLASLLATYREDEASILRAYNVGRRLRGTQVPPFQDTYGWLLFRRGEFEEALTYLEPAARALSRDPIVQFHLARTYAALGRDGDALNAFEKTVALAAENDPRPQIAAARTEIERLKE